MRACDRGRFRTFICHARYDGSWPGTDVAWCHKKCVATQPHDRIAWFDIGTGRLIKVPNSNAGRNI